MSAQILGEATWTRKGSDMTPAANHLSESKRALLERYLRGEAPAAAASAGTIPRRDPRGAAPLSFGQEQLWFLAQLANGIPVYNEPMTIRLPGPLNAAALEQSITELL